MAETSGRVAPRSYLFVPGDRPERFAKALGTGADSVILDLEDAVAPDAKSRARESVASALVDNSGFIVRINAAGTDWFDDDVAMCRQRAPLGIVVPKAEDPAQLSAVASVLPPSTSMLLLIETARGLHGVTELANVERVERLLFGSIDLQLDLGMDGEEELNPFRLQLVLASRLAGIEAPVDGVTIALDDVSQLEADVARARRLGFGGKLCIHPRQVAVVNRGFVPDATELQWAGKVVTAARNAGEGVVAVDGRMIDKPVIARAEKLLAMAETFGSR